MVYTDLVQVVLVTAEVIVGDEVASHEDVEHQEVGAHLEEGAEGAVRDQA